MGVAVTAPHPLVRGERRIIEVLILEHGLPEVYAAIAWIYADRLERFGGAAAEPSLRARDMALALRTLTDEAHAALAEALNETNRTAADAANIMRDLGL